MDLWLDLDFPLLDALTAGRLREAERSLGRSSGDRLVDDLLAAELANRRGQASASVGALADLAGRTARQAVARPVLRWWADALVGERCLTELDGDGVAAASSCLGQLPDSPLGPPPLLWIRGRLRRLAAVAFLRAPRPDVERHDRLRAAAIADFSRAELPQEIATTRLASAGFRWLWLGDERPANLDAIVDACDALEATADPEVVAYLRWGQSMVTLMSGGREAVGRSADACADTALAGLDPPRWQIMRTLTDVTAGRTVPTRPKTQPPGAEIVPASAAVRWANARADVRRLPADLTGMEAAFTDLRRADPRAEAALRRGAANVLADAGLFVEAGEIATPAMGVAASLEECVDEALTHLRMLIGAGAPVPHVDLAAVLDGLHHDGYELRALGIATRLARDLVAAGRPADAAMLGAWRPPERASVADRPAAPAGAAPEVTGSGLVVQVLAPVVVVTRAGGEEIPLRPAVARLLLALVVADPTPLHVEVAADALWPDVEWKRARSRLNAVVHRLRQALGPDAHGVVRSGPLLSIGAPAWDVDLFRLRHALRPGGPAAERARVLSAVTGNLADAQFPFDELLIEERRAVAGALARLRQELRTADPAHPARPGSPRSTFERLTNPGHELIA